MLLLIPFRQYLERLAEPRSIVDVVLVFLVVYGVLVISSVDNFVKPILMSRAGNLSMLLVVLGVFGGAIAFGFIGLFVGPALLAVGWNVTKAWLGIMEKPAAA